MADNDGVDVKLGGDSSEAKAALEDFSRLVTAHLGDAAGKFADLTLKVGSVTTALTALAGVAAVGFMVKSAKETLAWNQEVYNLSKTLGVTTEQAMTLNVALDRIDVSQSTYTRGVMNLTNRLKELEPTLTKNGVVVRDALTGQFRDGASIMQSAIDKINQIGNATDRNRAGLAMFGRSWGEMREMVKLTSAEMEEARQKIQQYNLTADPILLQRYKDAMDDLRLAQRALAINAGQIVLPTMTALAEWFGSTGPSNVNFFIGVLRELTVGFVGLASAIELGATLLGGFGALLYGLFDPSVKLKDVWKSIGDEIDRLDKRFEKFKEGVYNPKSTELKTGGGEGWEGKEGKTGKSGDRMSEWKAELQKMKDSIGAFHELEIEDEIRFWEEKMEIASRAGEWGLTEADKVFHEKIQLLRKANREELVEGEKQIQQKEALELKSNARTIERIRYLQQMGFMTEVQALQSIRESEEVNYQIRRESLEKRLDLYKEDKQKKAEILREIEKLDADHSMVLQKNAQDTSLANRKVWMDGLGAVTSAVDGSIKGMIMGFQTWRKAMSNILQAVLGEFISFGVKMLREWIVKEIFMTQATQAEVAARTAAEVAAGETAAVASAALKARKVVADSALVFSGVFASLAGIMGPAAAGPAAVSQAEVLAMLPMVTAEKGAWQLPGDTLMQAHKDEMVLPPDLARDVREAVGSGGGNRGNITFQITAMDSQDVLRALTGGALEKAIQQLSRQNRLKVKS